MHTDPYTYGHSESCPFPGPACQTPYLRLPGLEDLGCLWADSAPKSWDDARTSCQALAGDLAVMRTSQDFFRLRNYYAAQSAGEFDTSGDSSWIDTLRIAHKLRYLEYLL